ncbi:cation diffusion facilitator family transporter [Aestuariivirga sp.]|jgi:cation diffusion facilitator family transporter|uniref:cation diffusion facilitator family transporter n=1 Tax=Aestuariivirga sp. TaxID=2650926 RepID=UPI003784A58F
MNLNAMFDALMKLSRVSLFTLVPLTLAFIVTGYFSNSLTILSIAFDCGVSLIVQTFAFKSIRVMKSGDPIRFPHGTGKLENFSGLLYGALNIPVALYILYRAIGDTIVPTPIIYAIAQLPMLPSLLRSGYLFLSARRLQKQFDSPLIDSYVMDFRTALWFDGVVVIALALGILLPLVGVNTVTVYIDPVFSLCIALYLLRGAALLLLSNFKVLIDFPMPEDEQVQIIRVLAEEFDAYDQLGSIRTRRSGAQRFVDIELYFQGTVDVTSISALTNRIDEKLRSRLRDMKVSILVLETPPRKA